MASKRRAVSIALLLSAAACGDDSAGPTAGEITGTWQATQVEFVRVATPAVSVDLIAAGGSATLVLASDSNYTYTETPAGELPQIETGTWELHGAILTMTPSDSRFSLQFEVALSGDTLRLSGADVEYDFDGDHVAEPAKLNLVLVR
ncbi:MAG: lipocalin family protein [Gemmatimonadota bacterium]|nr:MAG: lipocalin family protein [Gemmatimonadota bacterium]